jgi:hypothetical protein
MLHKDIRFEEDLTSMNGAADDFYRGLIASSTGINMKDYRTLISPLPPVEGMVFLGAGNLCTSAFVFSATSLTSASSTSSTSSL